MRSLRKYTKIPFREAGDTFSSFFLDYIDRKASLSAFYGRFPELPAFAEQAQEKQKSFSTTARQALYDTLNEQYKDLACSEKVVRNLEALKDKNTFTVTTGHQLNIFTGPLYVIYKMASVINLCRQLNNAYPRYTFVPIYWMASEDHDFEEVNHVHIYGQKYVWKTMQQGAVGRFDPSALNTLMDDMVGDLSLFRKAYLQHSRLSEAVRFYINELFGKKGLLTVDADCRALKARLRNVVVDDLFNHTPHRLVEDTNARLVKCGYTPQVYVRQVNFFFLDRYDRSRLIKKREGFGVADGDRSWSDTRMKEVVDKTPERLSPNVVIRPLYQELILPNIAYVGGPSEVTYWLQLKGLFDHFKVPFPILAPRDFALILDGPTARTFAKTKLTVRDLFEDTHRLHARWARQHADERLSLDREKVSTQKLFDTVKRQATRIDPTLEGAAGAAGRHAVALLEKMEKKFVRAEKRKHSDALRQITRVKETLFPCGTIQERHDNFLNFYLSDPHFIDALIELFDPLDFEMTILCYPFTSP